MLFKKTCHICKKKSKNVTGYRLNNSGGGEPQKIYVCSFCREYAERRAFIKI